jgi:hypothetical protein
MSSKNLSQIKSRLRRYLEDKEILDIILFGSAYKGKAAPTDIDVAVITEKKIDISIPDFHISVLSPKDFIVNPSSLVNTLLREGYSLKNNKPFAALYSFSSRALFVYALKSLNASEKVKLVNILRGKRGMKGLVEDNSGVWLANQVFLVPVEKEYTFEKVFLNFKIKFKKQFILIH